jgi:hypothetical protein
VLEREAQALAPQTAALRAELASERSHRERLEARLARVDPAGEPLRPQAPVARVEPSPAHDHDAAPVAQAPSAEPESGSGSAPDSRGIVAIPAPVIPAPPAERVADGLVAQSSAAPMIDIFGDPDLPYAPALAPMPSKGASPPGAKSTATNATGLRRLIAGHGRRA